MVSHRCLFHSYANTFAYEEQTLLVEEDIGFGNSSSPLANVSTKLWQVLGRLEYWLINTPVMESWIKLEGNTDVFL